jgi:hypothetical protein
MAESDPNCAWCNEEAGRPQGEGSHTICDPHAEQVYLNYQASKQQKESEATNER